MPFGFRWRLRILPGIHLNLSKSGISLSLGGAPLTLNLRPGRIGVTASLPGTGLSFRTKFARAMPPDEPTASRVPDPDWKPITPLEGYRSRYLPSETEPSTASEPPDIAPIEDPLSLRSAVVPDEVGRPVRGYGFSLRLVAVGSVLLAVALWWVMGWKTPIAGDFSDEKQDSAADRSASGEDLGVVWYSEPVLVDVPLPKARPKRRPRS